MFLAIMEDQEHNVVFRESQKNGMNKIKGGNYHDYWCSKGN